MGDGGYADAFLDAISDDSGQRGSTNQKEKPVSEKQLHLDKEFSAGERGGAEASQDAPIAATVVKLIMQLRIEWVATCEDPTPSVPCVMYPEECPRPWQTFQVVFGGVFLNHY